MELTTITIIVLFAIVISNLLANAFPKIPLPLVQIACGVVIAFSPLQSNFQMETELFLGLLIAPLLYREAEEADLVSLWRVRKAVVFMVFGLVFLTVFAVGISVNLLMPAIPFAACCALGAILGPTDPIAVNSVSSKVEIDPNVMNVLKGEFLVNDSTGVISFTFASLAITSGTFSLGAAAIDLVYKCLVGLAIGLFITFVKNSIVRALRRSGVRGHASYIIIELLMPFLCFFAAEFVNASGIIAAVAAGSRSALSLAKLNIFEAELIVFKKSLWEIILLSINSFVFILLGLELPTVVRATLLSHRHSIREALFIALFVTVILMGVRFVSVMFSSPDIVGKTLRERLRNCLILTFSGVKGTISLATAFALPYVLDNGDLFEDRSFLLLVTGIVILYTIVLATVLLPLIAKPMPHVKKNEAHILVLKRLIKEVEKEDDLCANAVILHHKKKIRSLEYEDYLISEKKLYKNLNNKFYNEEVKEIDRALKLGKVNRGEVAIYNNLISTIESMQKGSALSKYRRRILFRFSSAERLTRQIFSGNIDIELSRLQEIFWANTNSVLDNIKENYIKPEEESVLTRVLDERVDIAEMVFERAFSLDVEMPLHVEYDREIRDSFDIERIIIKDVLSQGLISETEADNIRREINVMENFTIDDLYNDSAVTFLMKTTGRRHNSIKKKFDKISKDDQYI